VNEGEGLVEGGLVTDTTVKVWVARAYWVMAAGMVMEAVVELME
jgi:hypothetical protein